MAGARTQAPEPLREPNSAGQASAPPAVAPLKPSADNGHRSNRQEVSLQKSYLNPSWIILASPAVLIRPKFGDVRELAGFPRFTQLSRLKASARN